MGGFTTWGVQAAPLGASLLVQDHVGNMQDQPGNSGLTAWVVLANYLVHLPQLLPVVPPGGGCTAGHQLEWAVAPLVTNLSGWWHHQTPT